MSELRQSCEKGCEEVEELRRRLEEVIHVRDKLQEEIQALASERQNDQQEVSGSVGHTHVHRTCTDCDQI